jgi:hypothetical protein
MPIRMHSGSEVAALEFTAAAISDQKRVMSEMEEGGGWLWLLIAFGLVALGAAMAYASYVWRSERRRAREEQKAATRENYRRGG